MPLFKFLTSMALLLMLVPGVAFASVTTDWMMRSVIGVERVCRKEIGGTGPPAASSGAARAVRDLGLWQSGAAVLSGTRANTLASRIKTLGVQRK